MSRVLFRRSRKDYPKGVIGIYDNAGQSNESGDHYTVVFEPFMGAPTSAVEGHYAERATFPILTMSGEPFHPQGICISGETPFRPTGGWQSGPTSAGKTINFADLPADCQRAVKQNLLPICEQCGCDYADGGHYEDCTVETPYTVGDVAGLRGDHKIGRFESEVLARAFIETLPDYLSGRYYLDGPNYLDGPR